MIRTEHLTKIYGRLTAVDDISFTVNAGEAFALLGPNGSGKTTTMKSIIGLVLPTSGNVFVNGLDVLRHPKETRQLISYLPQRIVFPETQTAREIMRFVCRLRKRPLHLADEAIADARFNGFSNRPVSEYSGGMIQRLGLAVVSLPDTPILLLDEPTANLDPEGVKRFREFVLTQKESGKTIIFSTHLLTEAEQLADRVGIFVGGRLAAEESIASLRRAYHKNKTIEDMYLHYVGARHDDG